MGIGTKARGNFIVITGSSLGQRVSTSYLGYWFEFGLSAAGGAEKRRPAGDFGAAGLGRAEPVALCQ